MRYWAFASCWHVKEEAEDSRRSTAASHRELGYHEAKELQIERAASRMLEQVEDANVDCFVLHAFSVWPAAVGAVRGLTGSMVLWAEVLWTRLGQGLVSWDAWRTRGSASPSLVSC